MECKNQIVGRDSDGRFFLHPCGHCVNCRINDTRAWYVRSCFELKRPERPYQYFLTLTYNEENIPDDGLCQKVHLKHFLNNLNTSYDLYLRYFATSDYGRISGRCHYHAVLLSTKKITQSMIEKKWTRGFVYLKTLNNENLKYVLRYTVKKTPFDGSLKGWFRLISKGWGANVVDFYTGQEYFVFDGKKYGISAYLRQKLGLPKNEVDKTIYYDRLYLQYRDKIDSDSKAIKDDEKLFQLRRRYK